MADITIQLMHAWVELQDHTLIAFPDLLAPALPSRGYLTVNEVRLLMHYRPRFPKRSMGRALMPARRAAVRRLRRAHSFRRIVFESRARRVAASRGLTITAARRELARQDLLRARLLAAEDIDRLVAVRPGVDSLQVIPPQRLATADPP